MSGPNPPDEEPRAGARSKPVDEPREELTDTGFHRAYSARSPSSTLAPYVSADPALYDYDTYEPYDAATELVSEAAPPKWPWVVGVTAIVAAIALVVSVSLLVTSTDSSSWPHPRRPRSRPRRFRTRSPPRAPPPRRRPRRPRSRRRPAARRR